MSERRSALRRRLPVLLCTGLLVVVTAGCTRGTTSIPAGSSLAPISCPEEGKPIFVPGAGTTHVRLQVLRSNATVPLFGLLSQNGIDVFDVLWDGTQSTGPTEFPWDERPISQLILYMNQAHDDTDTTWAITALDRTGKDVGFTCRELGPFR